MPKIPNSNFFTGKRFMEADSIEGQGNIKSRQRGGIGSFNLLAYKSFRPKF